MHPARVLECLEIRLLTLRWDMLMLWLLEEALLKVRFIWSGLVGESIWRDEF